MPWLVHDDKVLATLEVASSPRERMQGLLGRDSIDGALLLDAGPIGAHGPHALRHRRGLRATAT